MQKLTIDADLGRRLGEQYSIVGQPVPHGRQYMFIRSDDQTGVPADSRRGHIVWNFEGTAGDDRRLFWRTTHEVQMTGGSLKDTIVPLTALSGLSFEEQAQGQAAVDSLRSSETINHIVLELIGAFPPQDRRAGTALTATQRASLRLSGPEGGGLVEATEGETAPGALVTNPDIIIPGIATNKPKAESAFNTMMNLFENRTMGRDIDSHLKKILLASDPQNSNVGQEAVRRLDHVIQRVCASRAMQLTPGVLAVTMQCIMVLDRSLPEKRKYGNREIIDPSWNLHMDEFVVKAEKAATEALSNCITIDSPIDNTGVPKAVLLQQTREELAVNYADSACTEIRKVFNEAMSKMSDSMAKAIKNDVTIKGSIKEISNRDEHQRAGPSRDSRGKNSTYEERERKRQRKAAEAASQGSGDANPDAGKAS